MKQAALNLDNTGGLDLSRFVEFQPNELGGYCKPAGVGRRAYEVGRVLGSLSIRHARGYAIVLQFPDGKIETFDPMGLFPADLEEVAAAGWKPQGPALEAPL